MASLRHDVCSLGGLDKDDFLRHCLGGGSRQLCADVDNDDFLSIIDEEEVAEDLEFYDPPENFAMNVDSDDEAGSASDCDSGDDDLDDIFGFDPEKVSDLLRKTFQEGASIESLSEVFQQGLAQQLEERLAAADELITAAVATDEARSANVPFSLDGRMTPGRLTPGRMTPGRGTPGRVTPPGAPEESRQPVAPPVNEVAERMQRAIDMAKLRKERRSSAVRRDALAQAMNAEKQRLRKSIAIRFAPIEEEEKTSQNSTANTQSRASISKRARQSIAKAAEVLEAAGVDESGTSQLDLTWQMRVVQKAMVDARKCHRKSIARAVDKVTELGVLSEENSESKNASGNKLTDVQERIQQAVAASHERRNRGNTAAGGADATAVCAALRVNAAIVATKEVAATTTSAQVYSNSNASVRGFGHDASAMWRNGQTDDAYYGCAAWSSDGAYCGTVWSTAEWGGGHSSEWQSSCDNTSACWGQSAWGGR